MRRLLERKGFQPSGVIDNLDEGTPDQVFGAPRSERLRQFLAGDRKSVV